MGKVDLRGYSPRAIELADELERAYVKGELDKLGDDDKVERLAYMRKLADVRKRMDKFSKLNKKNPTKSDLELTFSTLRHINRNLKSLMVSYLTDMAFDIENMPNEIQAYEIILRKHDPRDLLIEHNGNCEQFRTKTYLDLSDKEKMELLRVYEEISQDANTEVREYIISSKIGRKKYPDEGLSSDTEQEMKKELIEEYKRLKHMTKFMSSEDIVECYRVLSERIRTGIKNQFRERIANGTATMDYRYNATIDEYKGLQVIYTKLLQERIGKGKEPLEILESDLDDEPAKKDGKPFDIDILEGVDEKPKGILSKIRNLTQRNHSVDLK